MNIKKTLSLIVAMAFAFTVSAYACPKADKSAAEAKKTEDGAQVKTVSVKKPCCLKGAKAKTVANRKGCGKSFAKLVSAKPTCKKTAARAEKIDTILASLPAMTYKVGEMETPCSMSANAKAASSGAKIAYIVDGKSYEAKGEAVASLAGLLTEKYNELSHVQFVAGEKCYKCPMTASKMAKKANTKMKYRLAGFDFESKDRANKVAAEVQEAMAGMKIKYMSEGKPVTCLKSCKAAGKTVTYVVGDQETKCEQSAKLMLAKFIARSIVEMVSEST